MTFTAASVTFQALGSVILSWPFATPAGLSLVLAVAALVGVCHAVKLALAWCWGVHGVGAATRSAPWGARLLSVFFHADFAHLTGNLAAVAPFLLAGAKHCALSGPVLARLVVGALLAETASPIVNAALAVARRDWAQRMRQYHEGWAGAPWRFVPRCLRWGPAPPDEPRAIPGERVPGLGFSGVCTAAMGYTLAYTALQPIFRLLQSTLAALRPAGRRAPFVDWARSASAAVEAPTLSGCCELAAAAVLAAMAVEMCLDHHAKARLYVGGAIWDRVGHWAHFTGWLAGFGVAALVLSDAVLQQAPACQASVHCESARAWVWHKTGLAFPPF